MKRIARILSLTAVLLLVALLLVPVSAAAESPDPYGRVHDPNAPRIVDNLNLLSDAFEASLLQQIQHMQDSLKTDFVVVTTNDLGKYSADDYGMQNYADDFYDYRGYGIGPTFDGVILVIYISNDKLDRLYKFEFTGNEINRFSNSIELLQNKIVPFLKDGDYEGAVRKFFGEFEYKHHWYSRISFLKVLIAIGAGVVVGFIRLGSLKRKMRTVQTAVSAKNYLVDGSYDLRNMNEVFVRSVVSRTARESSNSSSRGGGGGSHFGSSGVSHSGGGGRF